jgi:polynucleotide 5'-hydroxyl-kinase GRC3/NOL9
MESPGLPADLPADWADALATLVAAQARRVLIAGPTDVGKSRFALAMLAAWAAAGEAGLLLDADPGQKMVGPPGAVTLGDYDALGQPVLEGLHFVGTTSAAAIGAIVDGAGRLARRAGDRPVAINSSGLVVGPGVPLALRTIMSAGVDRIVAIAAPAELQQSLAASGVPVIRLARPAAAHRKGRGERARRRRAAFEAYLRDAAPLSLPREQVRLASPLTACLASREARPVCALTDADGTDLAMGILDAVDDETIQLAAPPVERRIASLRLGAMWARRAPSSWALVDELLPAAR